MSADTKSLYRSLRRYYDTDMVEYDLRPNTKGPDLKVYKLSSVGEEVLARFVKRNIAKLITNKEIGEIIK